MYITQPTAIAVNQSIVTGFTEGWHAPSGIFLDGTIGTIRASRQKRDEWLEQDRAANPDDTDIIVADVSHPDSIEN